MFRLQDIFCFFDSMKKYLIFIFTIVLSISAIAQEVLSVKGVPVHGSVDVFIKQMKQKGLERIKSSFNTSTIFMEGNFMSRNAIFAILPDDDENVYKVSVTFDEQSSWHMLESIYHDCKKIYTKKYGNPIAWEEKIEDDVNKYKNILLGLHQGLITYNTFYLVGNGSIGIRMVPIGKTKGTVMILYENHKTMIKQMMKDLDDI